MPFPNLKYYMLYLRTCRQERRIKQSKNMRSVLLNKLYVLYIIIVMVKRTIFAAYVHGLYWMWNYGGLHHFSQCFQT